jgi:hypothetical protein
MVRVYAGGALAVVLGVPEIVRRAIANSAGDEATKECSCSP